MSCNRLQRKGSTNTYRRMGSNPMSPGMDPSNFSGRTKKGMALDISSAFKATDPARWDCYSFIPWMDNQPRKAKHTKVRKTSFKNCQSRITLCTRTLRTIEAGAKAEAEANKREKTVDFMVQQENTTN